MAHCLPLGSPVWGSREVKRLSVAYCLLNVVVEEGLCWGGDWKELAPYKVCIRG